MPYQEELAILSRLKSELAIVEEWVKRSGFIPSAPPPYDFLIGDFYIRDSKLPTRVRESESCSCQRPYSDTDAVGTDGCKATASTIKP